MTIRLTPEQSIRYDEGFWESRRLEETLLENVERQGITDTCVIETATGERLFTIRDGMIC